MTDVKGLNVLIWFCVHMIFLKEIPLPKIESRTTSLFLTTQPLLRSTPSRRAVSMSTATQETKARETCEAFDVRWFEHILAALISPWFSAALTSRP